MHELALLQQQLGALATVQQPSGDAFDEKRLQQWVEEVLKAVGNDENLTETALSEKLTKAQQDVEQYGIDLSPAIKDEVMYLVLQAKKHLLKLDAQPLSMCHCHPLPMRIRFIMKLVRDIQRTFTRDHNLTYVSMASGELLQDFLTIQALVRRGYTNIAVDFIDIEYVQVSSMYKSAAERDERRKKLMQTVEEIRKKRREGKLITKDESELETAYDQLVHFEAVERFMLKIAEVMSVVEKRNREAPVSIAVNHYDSVLNYLTRPAAHPADVIVMVDPNERPFSPLPLAQKEYPLRANVINLGKMIILFSADDALQIYKKDSFDDIGQANYCILQELRKNKMLSPAQAWTSVERCRKEAMMLSNPELENSVWIGFYDLVKKAAHEKSIIAYMYHHWPKKDDPLQMFFENRSQILKKDWIERVARSAGYPVEVM